MNRKLSAYTVMEMIVVMIISAIVVSMSYLVFRRTVLFSHKVLSVYNINYNVVLFDRLLLSDFMYCDLIQKTASGFECIHGKDRVVYRHHGGLSRAQAAQTDTLSGVSDLTLKYQYLDSTHTIIKELVMVANYEGTPIRRQYRKQYGSDVLMQLNE